MTTTQTYIQSTIQSADGTELAVYEWKTRNPVATLLIVHGYLEHATVYDEFASYLTSNKDIDVISYDFRGHGLSKGARGLCKDWINEYHKDLELVLDRVAASKDEPVPTFVLGHSNGGLVVLDYFMTSGDETNNSKPIKGLLVSSPWLAPATKLPYVKVLLSKLLGRFVPTLTLPVNENELSGKLLTHDPIKIKESDEDPLNLKAVTVGWAYQSLLAQERVLANDHCQLPMPVLFAYAGKDQIANPQINETFGQAIQSPDLTIVPRPHDHHEILNETNRTEVYERMSQWILNHV